MPKAYLGLGSNIGERISYIESALKEIKCIEKTEAIKMSSVYETEPWGIKDQDDYLNSAVEIYTELTADELLKVVKDIEKKIGRTENSRWTEREIDIDLLFYGDDVIKNENMEIPHSQIEKRKFVLIPMMEIAPDHIHPVFKKSISELLAETSDNLTVKKHSFRNTDK